ncbi:MAG: YHS domain-containing protein [Armatimonadota bacterium]
MKHIAAATIALSLLASAAFAGSDPGDKPTPKSPAKKVAAKQYCAVTGETLGSMGATGGSSVYKGKKYLFCCQGCKPQFDKNPEKYVKTAKTAIPVAPAAKPAKKA